jgi:uncharacterized membrane protein (DUF485 family)
VSQDLYRKAIDLESPTGYRQIMSKFSRCCHSLIVQMRDCYVGLCLISSFQILNYSLFAFTSDGIIEGVKLSGIRLVLLLLLTLVQRHNNITLC